MYCMSLAKSVICGRQYGWRYLYCTYYDHVRYKQTCRACGGFLALCLYCLQYISNVLIQKMVLGIRQCSRFVACSSRIIERMAISLHDGICSLFSTQPSIRGFFSHMSGYFPTMLIRICVLCFSISGKRVLKKTF